MGKIKYLFKRVLEIDYKRALGTIDHASKESGKSKLFILFDMIWCGLKYSAGPNDYTLFAFYNLTPAQRATYVTRGMNDRLVKKFNSNSYRDLFENKVKFNTLFKDYLKRDWLDISKATKEAFATFMENKEEIISKPLASSCGKGIEKLRKSDFENTGALFDYLKSKDIAIAEEVIKQHKDMASIYNGSVNTARLVTIRDKDTVEIVFAFMRIGNGGRVVDNLNSGGMTTPIEISNGEIKFPAADKEAKIYYNHPATNAPIVGFKIPYWNEAVSLVKKAAFIVPEVAYVGWDVAVTEEGPVFVEGNSYPGHDILQLPAHIPDKIGLKSRIEKYL